jgi:hypothetical protein
MLDNAGPVYLKSAPLLIFFFNLLSDLRSGQGEWASSTQDGGSGPAGMDPEGLIESNWDEVCDR